MTDVLARFRPDQRRDRDGQWTDDGVPNRRRRPGGRGGDRLGIADRAGFQHGEQVVESDRLRSTTGHNDIDWAVVRGERGETEFRIHTGGGDGDEPWDGANEWTAQLEPEQVAELRGALTDAAEQARRRRAEVGDDWDDDRIGDGTVGDEWGSVHWSTWHDDTSPSWFMEVRAWAGDGAGGNADGAQLTPAQVKRLIDILGRAEEAMGGSPDVSAAAGPALTRVPNVELVRTGRWPLSSGTWDASPADLVAAVAALNCPSIRRPVLKLGHVDPRFDGEPAIGYVDNLRITDGGHTLVGDYAGVPAWLGNIAASAYPDRSIEGTYGFKCQQGHSHPFVLTAVALLGVTPPGVGSLKSLQDVAALYGVDRQLVSVSGVKVVAKVSTPEEVRAADSPKPGSDRQLRRYWTKGEGAIKIKWGSPGDFKRCVTHLGKFVSDPEGLCAEYHHEALGYWPATHARMERNKKVHASPEEEGAVPNPEPSRADRIRSAFNSSDAPQTQWIVEIADDEIVVIDDTDRSLRRIPVTVGDEVTFGPAAPVRLAYVPADSELVSASATVFASREESRPQRDSGGDLPNGVTMVHNNTGGDLVLGEDLWWRPREGVSATVLDSPSPLEQQPPNPIAPVEPPPVGPNPTEEPQTPPDEGGVPASGEPAGPKTAGAEPEEDTEPKEGGVSTLTSDVRSRLGLPEDADDAAVLTALDGLKQKADQPTEPSPEQVAASAATAKENEELRKEVQVLASQMKSVATELAEAKAEKAAAVKASVIQEAIDKGRIAPADRERWEKDYDDAPPVITRVLASIPAYSAVPLQASGYTGTGEEAVDSAFDKDYETFFRTEKKAGV